MIGNVFINLHKAGNPLKARFFFLSLDMSAQLGLTGALFTCRTKDPCDEESILSERIEAKEKMIIEF